MGLENGEGGEAHAVRIVHVGSMCWNNDDIVSISSLAYLIKTLLRKRRQKNYVTKEVLPRRSSAMSLL